MASRTPSSNELHKKMSSRKNTGTSTTPIPRRYTFAEMEAKYWRTKAILEPRSTPTETPYVTSSQLITADEVPEAFTPRIFIERDYSDVVHPRFKVEMPQELEIMRVDKAVWERTITEINDILEAASELNRGTVYETILSFLTCYILNYRRKTYYQYCLDRLRDYIEYQNNLEYNRRGLRIMDPSLEGMRHLKLVVLDQAELTARLNEDMLSQRSMPAPVECRKKSDTQKLLSRVATHLESVKPIPKNPRHVPVRRMSHDPRPGTSASFGIPQIRPKHEDPPSPSASRGVHIMHYVVPLRSDFRPDTNPPTRRVPAPTAFPQHLPGPGSSTAFSTAFSTTFTTALTTAAPTPPEAPVVVPRTQLSPIHQRSGYIPAPTEPVPGPSQLHHPVQPVEPGPTTRSYALSRDSAEPSPALSPRVRRGSNVRALRDFFQTLKDRPWENPNQRNRR